MRAKIAALLSAAALLAIPFGAGADAHDVRALPFSFTETHLKQSNFGEPSIALSAKDHVFICGPTGVPGGINAFIRSADWVTFTRTNIFDRGGGGDCDVKVGPDGAVYTANLQIWASAIRKSVDDGVTFSDMATEDAVEQDRQWLATDPVDPNIVYLAYHDWVLSAVVVAKSLDGAKSFLIHSIVSSDPVITAQGGRSTIPGPIRVDPTNHERLYMVWSTGDTVDCVMDPAGRCVGLTHRKIVVGRSDDGGLTWVNRVAMHAPPGSQLGLLIPWMSVDAGGNVHVAVGGSIANPDGTKTNGIYLSSSSDRAETWSPMTKVNTGSGAAVFPTVVGGAPGIVNLAWIESTAPATADESGVWTVHFAQSRDAMSASPTFTRVNGPLIHRGDVCTQGLMCTLGGDRTLLDFMDMVIDSFGYAHIVVTSNEPSSTTRGRHVLYWRQDAGPSATSEPCANAGDAVCVTVRPGPQP